MNVVRDRMFCKAIAIAPSPQPLVSSACWHHTAYITITVLCWQIFDSQLTQNFHTLGQARQCYLPAHLSCSSVTELVWTPYFGNKWSDFDADGHKWSTGTKWSTLGVIRSKIKNTRGRLETWQRHHSLPLWWSFFLSYRLHKQHRLSHSIRNTQHNLTVHKLHHITGQKRNWTDSREMTSTPGLCIFSCWLLKCMPVASLLIPVGGGSFSSAFRPFLKTGSSQWQFKGNLDF